MSSTLGFLGIWVALFSAAYLAARGLLGVFRPDPETPRKLLLPVMGVFGGAVVAMLALEMALLADDFSVSYVANHSASSTPFLYKLASAWAALEGSLVLWALVLAAFILFIWIGHRRKGDADPLGAGALGVMGVVALFFFVMLATASNPFEICTVPGVQGCAASSALPWATAVAPLEGLGPNPLLQNHPLMAVHPPMLYVGYVGLTVPFAFGMAALIRAESGSGWLRRTASWTRIAWVFLTAGIVLGGLWSYEVLGWGGYWAWDPVENASFWPWLIATAFLHTASLSMRRGVLQAWAYILVIAAFSSTILGTFLTRSGVIVSVHSFSQSPIGPSLLWFLMFVLVASLGLFAARIHLVGSSPRLDSAASREGVFLINNLLLTVFALVVLVGTLYPLLWEAITGAEVGVGRPFYDRIAIPLSLLLIGAMGIGAVAPYRVARPGIVWERMRSPLRFGLAIGALAVLLGQRNGWTLVLSVLAGFIAGITVRQMWVTLRKRGWPDPLPLLIGLILLGAYVLVFRIDDWPWALVFLAPAGAGFAGRHVWAQRTEAAPASPVRVMRADTGYWGGQIAHLGVVVLALGIALSSNLSARAEFELPVGGSDEISGHTLNFAQPFQRFEERRTVTGVDIEVYRGDDLAATLSPRINQYPRQNIGTPAVMTTLRGDLYLSLNELAPDGSTVTLEVFWFPYIWLVWAGGFLTALGGVWSWLVKRPARAARDEEVKARA